MPEVHEFTYWYFAAKDVDVERFSAIACRYGSSGFQPQRAIDRLNKDHGGNWFITFFAEISKEAYDEYSSNNTYSRNFK